MRKRLRKKLHRDEFQEFGFLIVWQFHEHQNRGALQAFMSALVDAIEERGLTFGGGANSGSGSGFLCPAKRGSAQEADRNYLQYLLNNHPKVAFVQVEELEDAWNQEPRQYQHIIDLLDSDSELNKPTIIIMPPASA